MSWEPQQLAEESPVGDRSGAGSPALSLCPALHSWMGTSLPHSHQSLFKGKPKTAALLLEGNISIGARAVTHN